MSTKIRLLGILVLFSFLSGCGGGSTTKGASGAGFNITPYIGEWVGQINGPNAGQVFKDRFIIGQYGGVIDIGADPECPSGLAGKIINSNPFEWVANVECFVAGAGVCRLTRKGTMRLSGGNRITGEYREDGYCGVANQPVTGFGDFSYLKEG